MTAIQYKGHLHCNEGPRIVKTLSLSDGLELRPATKSDRGFMQQLFASTRDHLRHLPLSPLQIERLLEQQYQLQLAHYVRQWPDAHIRIIQLAGKAIGKIVLEESETTLHVLDIAIEPAMRGRGYGTSILRALQAAAEKHGLPIRLSVDRQNPRAKELYLSLGFQVAANSDTHESMVWPPPASVIPG